MTGQAHSGSGIDAWWAGALTGAAYGIGETFFVAVLAPVLAIFAGEIHTPLAPATTFVFLALYPVLGALVGFTLSLVLPRLPVVGVPFLGERSREAFGLASFGVVVLLLAANAIAAGHRGASAALAIGLPGLLVAVGLARYQSPRLERMTSGLAPLFGVGHLAWLTTGLLWVTLDHYVNAPYGLTDKARGAAIVIATGGAGSFLWQRMRLARVATTRSRAAASVAIAVGCVWLAALLLEYPPAPPMPAPSEAEWSGNGTPVILIVLDTLRPDHLDLYGYARETAPQLRRFAGTATRYDSATTSASYTLTGHAALFTGLYPSHNGSDGGLLPGDMKTLAEHLKGAGYETWGIAANNGFLGRGYGLDQGFDFIDARPGRAPFRPPASVFLRRPIAAFVRELFLRHLNTYDWRSAAEIHEATLPVLDEIARRERPFLLFLNYMDVHRPISPPAPWRDRYPGRDPDFDWSGEWHLLKDAVEAGEHELSERERANLISQYDGAIAYLDMHIGLLFDALRERDLFDRSLIIVTSDHGEAFGEKSTFGHGSSLYEGVARACLLIKRPAQTRAAVETRPTGVVDVLPTTLAALALPAAAPIDGVDLDASELDAQRRLLAESFDSENRAQRALYAGRDKLLLWPDGRRELYALAGDPDEEEDLAAVEAERVRELAGELRETAARNAYQPGGDREGVDERDRERLRALGYIQ